MKIELFSRSRLQCFCNQIDQLFSRFFDIHVGAMDDWAQWHGRRLDDDSFRGGSNKITTTNFVKKVSEWFFVFILRIYEFEFLSSIYLISKNQMCLNFLVTKFFEFIRFLYLSSKLFYHYHFRILV